MRAVRRSLLYHWSVQYLIVLLICMVVASTLIILLIYWNASSTQRNGLEGTVQAVAAEAANRGGTLPEGAELGRLLDQLARQNAMLDRSFVFIFDAEGRMVGHYPSYAPFEPEQLVEHLPDMPADDTDIVKLTSTQDQLPYLAAMQPIGDGAEHTGYVVYLVQKKTILKSIPIQHRVLRLSIVAIVLLVGWGILYLFTRRLLKPIQEAADAAKQIVAGNYHIDISDSHDEKEIYELMVSFKEMSDRLEHLESLRSQLILGVTHELKTPIASISGLVQAVKDDVVSGAEAREFLEMSLKETERLQKMVEDLLDFNRFAANTVTVTHQHIDLRIESNELVTRWKQAQEKQNIDVVVETVGSETGWQVLTDPVRFEQIMINLINNARDAMVGGGSISIRLHAEPAQFRIDVQDTGQGIPAKEQGKVFESFYRGEGKRNHIHGLGIGLPFSRLIARSLGGDLVLSSSSTEGTTFTLFIAAPRSD